MENTFIPQAIEIVTSAINEDKKKNYEEAFRLYKKALEHFLIGVKCTKSHQVVSLSLLFPSCWLDEKNPTSKGIIMKRVEGYMTRAEQLRTMLHKTIQKSDGTAELQKYATYPPKSKLT